LAGVIGGTIGIRQFYQTDAGNLFIDRLLLAAPVLGDLQRKAAVSRFTRTLGTLVSSGVSILEGLEITAKTAGNRVIHDAVMGSRASIAGGETIAGPLKESGVFPPMVVQMINVGEQTGGLDEMLSRVADFYDDEVDTAVEALLAALEPIMIVVLGVVVGGMIVAMYLPIFDMINAVQ
jgi:type IV pilus assembly protein PilC